MPRPHTREGWQRLLFALTGSIGYYQIHQALVLKLGWREAGMLHYLMNFHQRIMYIKGYKWNAGWFYCKAIKMENETGTSTSTQTRILHRLAGMDKGSNEIDKTKAFIETKKVGWPPKRHIRINELLYIETVAEWDRSTQNGFNSVQPKMGSMDQPKMGSMDQPKMGSTLSRKKELSKKKGKKEERNSLSEPAGSDVSTQGKVQTSQKKEQNKFDLTAVHRLKQIITSAGYTVNKKARMNSWALEFRRLRESDDAPRDEIKKIMRWYQDHIGEDFIPLCLSATSFRSKFAHLQAAMQRSSNGNRKSGNGTSVSHEADKLIDEME